MDDDIICLVAMIVFVCIVSFAIIAAQIASKSEKKELNKFGPNNRCVRSIIYAYQIISNSSQGYAQLVEIFDKSNCFNQLRTGNELFLSKGLLCNMTIICKELSESDEIDETFKDSLKFIDEEKLRILIQANKVEPLF